MIEAEDWASYFAAPSELEDKRNIASIRKIQADAIRWATNLSGPLRGQTALAKADELDPPEPKKPL